MKKCELCNGTGREVGSTGIECPGCKGTGQIERSEITEETVAPKKTKVTKKEKIVKFIKKVKGKKK